MPRKKKGKPVVLAITSDHHAGSTVGLCPPRITLDDGGDYVASEAQRWVWRRWNDYIKRVKEVAKENGVGYTAIFNGDIIEGNHHKNVQVISHNETTQKRVAEAVLKPILQDADKAYFTRGTFAHVGEVAQLEEAVAQNWSNTVMSGSNYTWRILPLTINGGWHNIAHHASIGRLAWTRTNSLGKHAITAEVNGYRRYGSAPKVLWRSHNHVYVDSYNSYPVRVIGLPAWQLTTGYVDRLDPDALADIGGAIVVCRPGGEYEIEMCLYTPKPIAMQRIVV